MKEFDFELAMYKKMYAIVCGTLSDSLELLDDGRVPEAKQLLREALERAEDCYISADI